MILIDNNILSTFAKIEKLDLLFNLIPNEQIGIVPAVHEELRRGVKRGYLLLIELMKLITEKKIKIVPLTEEEILLKANLPPSFDQGELETIAVCKLRNFKLLSNEKSVRNFCKRKKISYASLPDLLRLLWKNNIIPQEEIRKLIDQIEEKDNLIFKNKWEIFKE